MMKNFFKHEGRGPEQGCGEGRRGDGRYGRVEGRTRCGFGPERHGFGPERMEERMRRHGFGPGAGRFGAEGPGGGERGFGREHGGGGFGRGRGFGGGGGEFGGRGGGEGRLFGGGDLRFVVLQLLADGPSHGYELIKAIGERVGGQYQPSPGVVYPMLTMLEEMGQATVAAEGARKQYAITEDGRKVLEENRAAVDAIFARMDRMRAEQTSSPVAQIERAVMNFRMALRMKRGPLSTEQVHAITDIIDAAAKQIERL